MPLVECVHRKCTTLLAQLGLGLPDVVTNHDCINNELVSLHNRHLVDKLPYPDWLEIGERGQVKFVGGMILGYSQADVMRIRWEVAESWVDGRQVEQSTILSTINKFSGAKRQALFRGWHRNTWGLPQGRVDAFVKVDYYSEEDLEQKPPRMIQYRGPAFNIELAPWLGPAEEMLLHGPGLGPTRLPSCSKGMTPLERAQVMADKRYYFSDPVAVCMDYSAFDSTQFTHILRQEHEVWKLLCPGINSRLLNMQLFNNCRTKNGVRYRTGGTRMSGDRNTGGGNSVTNVLNFYTICRMLGIEAEFLCDGDDSVAWMERTDAQRFMRAAEPIVGKVFGMILKDCTLVESADQEYYCQHKNVFTRGGLCVPTRDPIRIFTRLPWTPTGVRGAEALDLLLAKMVGEMLVSQHVPAIARALQSMIVKVLDTGQDWISGDVALAHLRVLQFSQGLTLETHQIHNLNWVRELRFPDDPVADAEVERLFCLPFGFMNELAVVHRNMKIHPSAVSGNRRRRARKVGHGSEYCDECDRSELVH